MSRKLDVGCGNTITPGYERLDIDPRYPALDYLAEIDAVPVEDGTFETVRASHVIEHVPLNRVRQSVLPEWFRICQPGGKVWIDTPNLALNARLYVSDSDDWLRYFNKLTPGEQAQCSLNGVPNKSMWMNFKTFSSEAIWNVHYWNADPTSLVAYVEEAGFINVRVIQEDPSVIVEGTRP